ncbi:hypothetical protein AAFF_G00177810 [Aldrovandia affinis]|uniref:Fe2OG dioxygenase domain-containing protein n=1 Tax=Aldrovandia affinis TaxID=143900 RepID=A0AAD7RKV8_9TELE|nr:hypothetical protein AAFF_G00177810 [Aldrovandia affinis]
MQCNEDNTRVKFYSCSCYYTDNIFLEEYKLHIRFLSAQQFRTDYQTVLTTLGCSTDRHYEEILKKIEEEVERRRQLGLKSAERSRLIKEAYKPLHKQLYFLQESYLAPEFLHIVNYCRSDEASEEGLLDCILPSAAKQVYRFPVFNKKFCEELIEELEHFERSEAPKGRPNTMNNYGILLNELGFDEGFITPLRENYLRPVAALLYPDCGGHCLDSHKAFVEFTEGNLYFGDMRQVPLSDSECAEVEHRVAEGLLHRGQQMHGALPISSGQRWNLIIWMRASSERNKLCPMCSKQPRLVQGDRFADGFTADDSQSGISQNMRCILN